MKANLLALLLFLLLVHHGHNMICSSFISLPLELKHSIFYWLSKQHMLESIMTLNIFADMAVRSEI